MRHSALGWLDAGKIPRLVFRADEAFTNLTPAGGKRQRLRIELAQTLLCISHPTSRHTRWLPRHHTGVWWLKISCVVLGPWPRAAAVASPTLFSGLALAGSPDHLVTPIELAC